MSPGHRGDLVVPHKHSPGGREEPPQTRPDHDKHQIATSAPNHELRVQYWPSWMQDPPVELALPDRQLSGWAGLAGAAAFPQDLCPWSAA